MICTRGFLKALEKTLFHFFSALGFRAVAKKMKVCFVRWHRNSNYFFLCGGGFLIIYFLCGCLFVQSGVGC
jgi:hypothetical protein